MFRRSPEAKEKRAKQRVEGHLNRQLNRELGLPKRMVHAWSIVNLKDPTERSWGNIDGRLPLGKLAVTAVSNPENGEKIRVAATEIEYPPFQFPPYRPATVRFGVMVPRLDSDSDYDAVLRLTADDLPDHKLPEFTVRGFDNREQFLGAVAAANRAHE